MAFAQDPTRRRCGAISNRYYHGINVITLASLLEHVARANGRNRKCDVPDLEQLKVVVRVAALADLQTPRSEIWARAPLGELALVSGETGDALEQCEQAIADPDLTWFSVRSMHEQVQLSCQLGFRPDAVAPAANLLQARCEELGQPGHRYGKVVIGGGHRSTLQIAKRRDFLNRNQKPFA